LKSDQFPLEIKDASPLSWTLFQIASTQEYNGLALFTKSEINKNADHAGLLLPRNIFQIDSALLQRMPLMLFFHHKTWSHVMTGTLVAVVVTFFSLWNTSNQQEL
jgi:hypothetical protein